MDRVDKWREKIEERNHRIRLGFDPTDRQMLERLEAKLDLVLQKLKRKPEK